MRSTESRHRLVWGAALPVVAAIVLLPRGAGSVVYAVAGAAVLGGVVLGLRRNPAVPALAVTWVAVGTVALLGADLVVLLLPSAGPAWPWRAALYAAAHAVGALVVLAVTARWSPSPGTVWDSVIVTANAALLWWVLVLEPVVGGPVPGADGLDPEQTTAVMLYGAGSLVLLGACVHAALSIGSSSWAGRLLLAGVVVLAVSDWAWLLAADDPRLRAAVPTMFEVGHVLAYLLWAAAMTHPSLSALWAGDRQRTAAAQATRIAMLAGAAVLGPATIVVQTLAGRPLSVWPVMTVTVVVIGAVAARFWGLVRTMAEQTRRLAAVADVDHLTGLSSRHRLVTELRGRAERGVHGGALLVVALDGLSEINLMAGHAAGDGILREAARRVHGVVGPDTLQARIAGASLAVLDEAARDEDAARDLALRVRHVLLDGYDLPEGTVYQDARVGVVLLDGPVTAGAVLSCAESTLAAAADDPGGVAVAVRGRDPRTVRRRPAGEVRAALASGQIVLHYQPQVSLAEGRVTGVEALARWEHPEQGLLRPGVFLPAVEESGLIVPFTRYVLDKALEQGARWRAEGSPVTVAVNLSVRSLLDQTLAETVADALDRHGLTAAALELEITESSAMVDPRRSIRMLGALAEMGVTLSLDDYGTGYSSLAYLQRLPVSRLKIDRSFVQGVVRDQASAAIVRSTVDLAAHLGMTVLAEGVEDDPTLLALYAMGCSAAQGFGLARPVPAADLPTVVSGLEDRLVGLVPAPGCP